MTTWVTRCQTAIPHQELVRACRNVLAMKVRRELVDWAGGTSKLTRVAGLLFCANPPTTVNFEMDIPADKL